MSSEQQQPEPSAFAAASGAMERTKTERVAGQAEYLAHLAQQQQQRAAISIETFLEIIEADYQEHLATVRAAQEQQP